MEGKGMPDLMAASKWVQQTMYDGKNERCSLLQGKKSL